MWFSAGGCIITLALSLLVAPLAAEAQLRVKVPRIGYIGDTPGPYADAFRHGLRERGYIEGTLAEAKGNKAEAARRLGITRYALYRTMKRLGIYGGDDEMEEMDRIPAAAPASNGRSSRDRRERSESGRLTAVSV